MDPKFRTKVEGGNYPVVAIVRVSSLRQSEVQHGSLEQQKNAITKRVQELKNRTGKNYYILEFVEEDSGVSARFQNTHNRKDLKRVEELIKSGKAKVFFCDRLDRLARDSVYLLQFLRMINSCGAEFYEVDGGQVDFKKQDQRFSYMYKSFNAEVYSENLGKNVKTQGRRARLFNGKDGNTTVVFGLDAHPTLSCMYVKNSKEAEQLNMLGWYAVKYGYVEAAKYGNSLGIRTKVKTIKEKISKTGVKIPAKKIGGKALTGKIVESMLASPKVWGVSRFKDDLNEYPDKQDEEGYVEWRYAHGSVLEPALIEELKKLQDSNKKHNPTFSDEFLLSGFLEAEDGLPYRGDSTTKKHKDNLKYTYYVAKTKLSQIRRLNAKALEADILAKLKEYLQGSYAFQRLITSGNVEANKRTQEYDTQIGELKIKANALEGELEKFSAKIRQLVLADTEDFQDVLLILKDEKSKVEDELNILKESMDKLMEERSKSVTNLCDKTFLEKFQRFFSEFEKLPNCDKKILLKALCPKIIVHGDFRIEMKVNPVFYEGREFTAEKSEKLVRIEKRWLGRWDSNPRPID